MTSAHLEVDHLSQNFREIYKKQKVILTFEQYIALVEENPRKHIRNTPLYLLDMFKHFKSRKNTDSDLIREDRFCVYDFGTERSGPIIGGEQVQKEIYDILESFGRVGYANKMILLHGPNGSAKSSTVESIANAMQNYSEQEEGAVYRFNWIFPTDKEATPTSYGESLPIGFSQSHHAPDQRYKSFALIDESKIASKIKSDLKENPIFLLPMPYREKLLKSWISKKENISEHQVELPFHILSSSLSKINQQIFENLLYTYDGNLSKVYRHIQVERFFYSKQYRVGISTVEPQMSVDAREKQLTLDKNYSNIPAVLHTINFFQMEGNLVESNRGILEFSDLLKRPVEAFKYLLSSIEKGLINLTSGTAHLDVVYMATTNEKHLDAFKTIPDFSSFKGRFELITVPYLLLPSQEEKIYATDIAAIKKLKPVAPHTLSLLCNWAVMTRLKQPDPDNFQKEYRSLVAKLDPRLKVLLYEKKSLQPIFTISEENMLFEIRQQLWNESVGMVVYEGRFGASPREIRAILHRASQNHKHQTITALTIFEELRKMAKDRTIYEFLQFEPRGRYHDANLFIDLLEEEFIQIFEMEAIQSMSMADEKEYDALLRRYINHVVAEIKKEKIWDDSTSTYVKPSQNIMKEVEQIIEIQGPAEQHREGLLSRIAAYRIDHPKEEINFSVVFHDFTSKIKQHFYKEKRKLIESNLKMMVEYYQNKQKVTGEGASQLSWKIAAETYERLEKQYGYDSVSAFVCVQAVLLKKYQ